LVKGENLLTGEGLYMPTPSELTRRYTEFIFETFIKIGGTAKPYLKAYLCNRIFAFYQINTGLHQPDIADEFASRKRSVLLQFPVGLFPAEVKMICQFVA
jgi:hypothetical protein